MSTRPRAIATSWFAVVATAANQQPPARPALLDQYCLTCHNGRAKAGGLAIDALVVAEAFVGKNLVMKRFSARARGRASRIEKPFSEITIVVRELGEAA